MNADGRGQVRPWMADAACLDTTDPDRWFATDQATQDRAKAVCRTCPVRRRCLNHAILYNETDGIWGGYTPDELDRLRHKIRRRIRDTAA